MSVNPLLIGLIGILLPVATYVAGLKQGKKRPHLRSVADTANAREDTKNLAEDDIKRLRQRVEYEDDLLNTRTNIVLTLNGLMAVAASLSLPHPAQLVAPLVIITIDILWIVCAFDARHFIHSLTAVIQDSGKAPIDEKLRKTFQTGRFRIGSTRFLSVIIPTLLVIGWVLVLVVVAGSQ